MHNMSVQIAIIKDGKILLQQREDFETWGLPGGAIEAMETPAEAAVREAHEETGLNVEITHLVGLYTKPYWNSTVALFAATVIDGEFHMDQKETIDLEFFAPDKLPNDLVWWSKWEIADALQGIGGSVACNVDAPLPKEAVSRAELYQNRDDSGLARPEYFHKMFPEGTTTYEIKGQQINNRGEG